MTRWGTNKFRVRQLLTIQISLRIRAYHIRLSMVSFRNDAINVIFLNVSHVSQESGHYGGPGGRTFDL